MKLNRRPVKRGRIEMVPLIDCMFLLLVFFIYSMLSMVLHRGVRLDLPKAHTAPVHQEDYVSISIARDAVIHVDQSRVTLDELGPILQHRKELQPDLKVFIGGDREVQYERVIQVLDIVRQAGVSQVTLETKWTATPDKI
jgi:biopolymer transport protein ExbD